MKQVRDIEKKAAAVLESLDGIQRATPQPYFYTRLRTRISREEGSWGTIARIISRPLFALSMIAVVLFVNAWILLKDGRAIPQPANAFQVATDLPEEYNVAVTSFYDYETPSHE